jgi:hypothetical protein
MINNKYHKHRFNFIQKRHLIHHFYQSQVFHMKELTHAMRLEMYQILVFKFIHNC